MATYLFTKHRATSGEDELPIAQTLLQLDQ
jgi:hypothetical protein